MSNNAPKLMKIRIYEKSFERRKFLENNLRSFEKEQFLYVMVFSCFCPAKKQNRGRKPRKKSSLIKIVRPQAPKKRFFKKISAFERFRLVYIILIFIRHYFKPLLYVKGLILMRLEWNSNPKPWPRVWKLEITNYKLGFGHSITILPFIIYNS